MIAREQITNEIAPLNELEAFVNQNGGISFSAILEKEDNILIPLDLVDMEASSLLAPEFRIEDMDWGSFAWGFCCCPIGFFTVAVNSSKSQNEKLSYWIGVGVNTILSVISNTIYYLTAPRFII